MAANEELTPLIGNEISYDSRSELNNHSPDDQDRSDSHIVSSSHNQSIPQSSYNSCGTAIFLTVNATLGAGLLNIPHAFDESGGLIYATIIQTVSHAIRSILN